MTSRRLLARLLLLIVVPVLALLVVAVVYLHGGRYVSTDNAYVKSDKVPISAQVSGAIAEVLVRENQPVTAGQVLLRLDDAAFRVAVAKAEAGLAQARTDLAALRASYREAEVAIALARTRKAYAEKDEHRKADLAAKDFVATSALDDSRLNADVATQQLAAAQADLARLAEALGGDPNRPIEQHPAYRTALAALAQAKLDLEHAEVRAPVAGVVSKLPKPGQYLQAGGIAMVLVVSGAPWVEANFPEKDLTYVRPDQPVTIRVDTYPGVTWHGAVEGLSPATGAEFSILPAQNATGNWVKIAQRVPVRIRIGSATGVPPGRATPALAAGLSTEVTIDTGHRRRFLGVSL
jgi:membrane fusion protein (multidrug efflux system)